MHVFPALCCANHSVLMLLFLQCFNEFWALIHGVWRILGYHSHIQILSLLARAFGAILTIILLLSIFQFITKDTFAIWFIDKSASTLRIRIWIDNDVCCESIDEVIIWLISSNGWPFIIPSISCRIRLGVGTHRIFSNTIISFETARLLQNWFLNYSFSLSGLQRTSRFGVRLEYCISLLLSRPFIPVDLHTAANRV